VRYEPETILVRISILGCLIALGASGVFTVGFRIGWKV